MKSLHEPPDSERSKTFEVLTPLKGGLNRVPAGFPVYGVRVHLNLNIDSLSKGGFGNLTYDDFLKLSEVKNYSFKNSASPSLL